MKQNKIIPKNNLDKMQSNKIQMKDNKKNTEKTD